MRVPSPRESSVIGGLRVDQSPVSVLLSEGCAARVKTSRSSLPLPRLCHTLLPSVLPRSAFADNLSGASPDSAFHRACQAITADFTRCSLKVREVEAQLRAEGAGRADLADVVRCVQEQEREKLHLTAVHHVLRKSLRPSDRPRSEIVSFLPQRHRDHPQPLQQPQPLEEQPGLQQSEGRCAGHREYDGAASGGANGDADGDVWMGDGERQQGSKEEAGVGGGQLTDDRDTETLRSHGGAQTHECVGTTRFAGGEDAPAGGVDGDIARELAHASLVSPDAAVKTCSIPASSQASTQAPTEAQSHVVTGGPATEASPPGHGLAAPAQGLSGMPAPLPGLSGMPAPLPGIPPEAAAAAFTAALRAGGCGCEHSSSSSSSSSSNAAGGGTGSGAGGHGEEDGKGEWEEQCAVARLDAEYDAAVAEVRQALARIVGDINEALEEVRYEVAELVGEADVEDAA
ncbi:unnamed protein product [Closterium sp. Naga37s-1]|nr:unnamed protein product [Closterium sp. Naga37s-1]CAI5531150.1 unnamed protein product [Closterium sp. Naga37s-1]